MSLKIRACIAHHGPMTFHEILEHFPRIEPVTIFVKLYYLQKTGKIKKKDKKYYVENA